MNPLRRLVVKGYVLIPNDSNQSGFGATGCMDLISNQSLQLRMLFSPNSNNYSVTLNNSYLTYPGYNMSQEAWAQIIIHEILHIFISQTYSTVTQQGLDHVFIFKNLVNPTADLLVASFGMSQQDATDLALNGLGDLWQYSDFTYLCISTYGRTPAQINATFNDYTRGTKGKKC